jgi:hypothetical protein
MIIWLISYPRSGNTLTRSVFSHFFGLGSFSIHGDKSDIGSNPQLSKLVGHIKGDRNNIDLALQRAKKEPVLIKSHEGPNSAMSSEDKYIHIVRDGRDSTLSYYYYLRDIAGLTEIALEDVIAGRVSFGAWGRHTSRWCQAAGNNLVRFRFEDIVKDISGFANELAPLIGLPLNSEPFPGIEEFKSAAPNFVRSGKTGGWREEFSPLQLAHFAHHNGVAMRMMGYDGPDVSQAEADAYSMFWDDVEADRNGLSLRSKLLEAHARLNHLERKKQKKVRRINRLRSLFGLRSRPVPIIHKDLA